jgi:hypothetical protein
LGFTPTLGQSGVAIVCVFKDERNIQVFLALYVDDLFILNESIDS